jgi:hypothetical protein
VSSPDLRDNLSSSPLVGSDVAEKVMLGIKDNGADETRDRLTFKFIRGTTAREGREFGNPQTSTTYTLCLYGSGTLLGQAKVGPHGTHWQPIGTDAGFKYKDSAGTQDGIGKVMLKAGHTGEAAVPKVQVTGKGTGLPDVTLPLAEPVQAQVHSSDGGLCFEGQWSGSTEIIKNDPEKGLFKATK